MKLPEAAAYLQVIKSTMWRVLDEGEIREVQYIKGRGSPVLVYQADLDALIERKTSGTPPSLQPGS